MSKISTRLMSLIAALALMAGISVAHAAPVSFSLVGNVDYADFGNDFGLATNDDISGIGSYDDSSLTGIGTESILFSGGNTLSLTVGSESFTQADDLTPASLVFDGGVFQYLSFSGDAFSFGFFDSYPCGATCFEGEDDNFNIIEGTWTSFTTTVVPVPAAVWLFGSGLLGLAGLARRKRS